MKPLPPKEIEAWDYFTFADGSVRLAKLRWRLHGFGERTCLGVVEGTASPLDMRAEFQRAKS